MLHLTYHSRLIWTLIFALNASTLSHSAFNPADGLSNIVCPGHAPADEASDVTSAVGVVMYHVSLLYRPGHYDILYKN